MDKLRQNRWAEKDILPIKCMMDVNRNIRHLLDKKVKINGLSSQHIRLLAFIYYKQCNDLVLYQKDIEEEFRLRKSSVSGVLQQLESMGYVTRICDETDSRYKRLTLTEEGIKIHKESLDKLMLLEKKVRSALTDDEYEKFLTYIYKIDTKITDIYEEE